jgi:glycosyltransferase involved in cell wall biosynthesis
MSSHIETSQPDARAGSDDQEAGLVKTSLVLPTYNEVENVTPVVEGIVDAFDTDATAEFTPIEVVVVDDGSTDGTRDVLRNLAAEVPDLRVVFLRRNFGQSAALAAGLDHARGEFVVTMDADGQNDPADAPRLLEMLTAEGYDCVSGWRRDRDDPASKTIPSAIQTRLAKLTGPDINDFGCTLKAYRAGVLDDIDLYGEGHRYIPAKLYKRGYQIGELEVEHHPRTAGETKYGAARLARGFVDLLFHVFWNRYSTRPLHLLGGLGFLFTAVGGLIGTHAVAIKYLFGVSLSPEHLPRLILTIAFVLFGVQLLMFGFLAEMIAKLHYSTDQPYRITEVIGKD